MKQADTVDDTTSIAEAMEGISIDGVLSPTLTMDAEWHQVAHGYDTCKVQLGEIECQNFSLEEYGPEALGVLARTKTLAFTMSGSFTDAAGVHYAFLLKYSEPSLFGAQDGVQLALMVLLGGAVPLLGPLIGTAVVQFIPDLPFVDNPNCIQITYGLALILLLPHGIVSDMKALAPAGPKPVASRAYLGLTDGRRLSGSPLPTVD